MLINKSYEDGLTSSNKTLSNLKFALFERLVSIASSKVGSINQTSINQHHHRTQQQQQQLQANNKSESNFIIKQEERNPMLPLHSYPSTNLDQHHYADQQKSVMSLEDQIAALVSPLREKLINESSNVELNYSMVTALTSSSGSDFIVEQEEEKSFFNNLNIILTIVYLAIFIIGVIGNICNCLVIADSKNKYMKTATNYYLFSLSISDLLLLIFGIPHDIVNLWHPTPYLFGKFVCISRGWISEASTNASVLVIVAFTVERYLAICHPLKAHTLSRLSRSIKIIILIWLVASSCAIVVVNQYGVVSIKEENRESKQVTSSIQCTMVERNESIFELSVLIFFIIPMAIITLLYLKLGFHLRQKAFIMKRNQQRRKERRKRNDFDLNNDDESGQQQHQIRTNRLSSNNEFDTENSFKTATQLELRSSSVCCQPSQDCSITSLGSNLINYSNLNSNSNKEAEPLKQDEKHHWLSKVFFYRRKSNNNFATNLDSSNAEREDELATFSQTTTTIKMEKDRLAIPILSSKLKISSGELCSATDASGADDSALNLSLLGGKGAPNSSSSCHVLAGEARVVSIVIDKNDGDDDEHEKLNLNETIAGNKKRQVAISLEHLSGEERRNISMKKKKKNKHDINSNATILNPLSIANKTSCITQSCSMLSSPTDNSFKSKHDDDDDDEKLNLKHYDASFTSRKQNFQPTEQSFVKIPNGASEQANPLLSKSCVPSINNKNKLSLKQKPIALQSTANTANVQNVIKMLVCVVVMFFICWAPFHAQRLMAVYVTDPTSEQEFIFSLLNHISGVSYYISAVVNPILYSLFSVKFRQAFKDKFARLKICDTLR